MLTRLTALLPLLLFVSGLEHSLPARSWDSSVSAQFLSEHSIVSIEAAELIKSNGLTIVTLWDIVEAYDVEVMRDLGLPTSGIPMYRLKADLAQLLETPAPLAAEGFGGSSLGYGDLDFFEVRELDKARFDAFLAGCASSPQATILAYYLHDYDFLEHFIEADETGVFFWLLWLLAPNVLAARMLWNFSDTNPIASSVFALAQLASFVVFVAALLRPNEAGNATDGYLQRGLHAARTAYGAALASVILWRLLISYILFGWFEDFLFYAGFFVIAGRQLVILVGIAYAALSYFNASTGRLKDTNA